MLGCEVVETSALKGIGSKDVAQKAIELAQSKANKISNNIFSDSVEKAISKIENIIKESSNDLNLRWFAIKLFERDEKINEQISLDGNMKSEIEEIISDCESKFDDDGESIITNERYEYISKVIKQTVHTSNKVKVSVSDKVDRIVTNRILALPSFCR